MKVLHSWKARFRTWWHSPVTSKDRLTGAVIAAFAGFWVAVLVLVALGAFSRASSVSGWWAFVGVVPFAILGYAFPKWATIVLFPFASIGGGV
ncbi:MAG: hypothetical protein U1E89_22265 [Burkholderiaceae bacterium]